MYYQSLKTLIPFSRRRVGDEGLLLFWRRLQCRQPNTPRDYHVCDVDVGNSGRAPGCQLNTNTSIGWQILVTDTSTNCWQLLVPNALHSLQLQYRSLALRLLVWTCAYVVHRSPEDFVVFRSEPDDRKIVLLNNFETYDVEMIVDSGLFELENHLERRVYCLFKSTVLVC